MMDYNEKVGKTTDKPFDMINKTKTKKSKKSKIKTED